ncbi:MAG: inositol monophosphatase family protein [Gemmatimonadota bacterium]
MQRDTRDLASHLLSIALRAAEGAAAYIRERSLDLATVDWQTKARADFVSDVDRDAESLIAESLLTAVPDAIVIGEELTPRASGGTGISFVVDPLDGTTNFLHGYPQYAVSIAAVLASDIVAGVVIHVPRSEVFTAVSGGGAFLGDARIKVTGTADPGRALIGTGFPFKHADKVEPFLLQLRSILGSTAGVRRSGAAALDLADVAAGRFDGFWELRLAPWDLAAGVLLVREAGGIVTDLDGRRIGAEHSSVVAANGKLHSWLIDRLRDSSS